VPDCIASSLCEWQKAAHHGAISPTTSRRSQRPSLSCFYTRISGRSRQLRLPLAALPTCRPSPKSPSISTLAVPAIVQLGESRSCNRLLGVFGQPELLPMTWSQFKMAPCGPIDHAHCIIALLSSLVCRSACTDGGGSRSVNSFHGGRRKMTPDHHYLLESRSDTADASRLPCGIDAIR
jgi:hypothetical protein